MKINLLLILVLIIFSCQNEEKNDKPNENKIEVGEINHVETLFDEIAFEDSGDMDLLRELQICDTIQSDTSNCVVCSSRNFRILPFHNSLSKNDAFMLQIKALTVLKGQNVKLPVRHLILFERENGHLVKVNGFRGNLIATRESDSGAKDLIIRFYIAEEEAFLNCLFTWNGQKYRFISVEAIDGAGGHGSVKESVKKEVSKEVYQTLVDHSMLF